MATAPFQLISDVIAAIQYRADIQGQDDRHPSADLLRELNESIGTLITKLTDYGYEWFIQQTTPASLSLTAAFTGAPYSEESWPVNARRILKVMVQRSGSASIPRWTALKPISLSGVWDYQAQHYQSGLDTLATPRAFALRLAPFATGAAETAGKIIITPLPKVARTFTIFYLPYFAPLGLTDEFNGGEDFLAWCIWDVVIKVAGARDNDVTETYKIALAERDRIERVFAKAAPRTQDDSSEEPRRADEDYDDRGPRELV